MIGNLYQLVKEARRVYVIGNGGSFANAQHIVNDLLDCGVRAFTMDPSTLTAFGNDYGYAHVFSRWLSVVGEEDDLLIALSGSGKSPNILNAVEVAENLGMKVWREFGAHQGLDMQSAEERQVFLGHELRRMLKP